MTGRRADTMLTGGAVSPCSAGTAAGATRPCRQPPCQTEVLVAQDLLLGVVPGPRQSRPPEVQDRRGLARYADAGAVAQAWRRHLQACTRTAETARS